MYKSLKRYWKIVFAHPLDFFLAYIASMICNFLLTLQPAFVKVYINEATRGVEKNHLVIIASFMIVALVLAFFFDTLQVTASITFKLKVEQVLRSLHQKYSQYQASEKNSLVIQRGIHALTEFTVLTSLELLLVVSNIIMVMFFLIVEDQITGLCVLGLLLLNIFVNIKLTKPIGRIASYKENIKTLMVKKFSISPYFFERMIGRLQFFEFKRFFLDTIFIFSSFSTFRLMPAIILLILALFSEKSVGSIASLFLYFNLLHKPYLRLINLLKQAVLYYSQTSLYRDSLEAALDYEHTVRDLPFGLVIGDADINAGAKLSKMNEGTTILKDDETLSEQRLKEILALSKVAPVVVYTKNTALINHAQFYLKSDGVLQTMPKYLMGQPHA